jgi:hypothetical protein
MPLRVRNPHRIDIDIHHISDVHCIVTVCSQNDSNQVDILVSKAVQTCTPIWVVWLYANAFLRPSSIFSAGSIAQYPRVIPRACITWVLLFNPLALRTFWGGAWW